MHTYHYGLWSSGGSNESMDSMLPSLPAYCMNYVCFHQFLFASMYCAVRDNSVNVRSLHQCLFVAVLVVVQSCG